MRTAIGVLALACTVCGAAWATGADELQRPDIVVRFRSVLPRNSQDWNTSNGGEIQARFWRQDGFGTALSLGIDSWSARNERTQQSDASGASETSIFGTAKLVPIGVSLLYRNAVADRVAVVFETGLKYAFADSGIHAEVTLTENGQVHATRDTILTDSTVLWDIGVSIEGELEENISLLLGLGYQTDLSSPRETFRGEDIGSTSFQAAIVRFGVRWTF